MLYFPTYKDNPIIQQCNVREKQLLSLLEIDRDLFILELEKIREAYLTSFNNEKIILWNRISLCILDKTPYHYNHNNTNRKCRNNTYTSYIVHRNFRENQSNR